MGQAKTKRARTSFKHHQLRIMKAHFQVNQNPDSRELKMLSQKTGLDKKVLQVRGEGGSVYKMLNHAWRVPNLAIHPTSHFFTVLANTCRHLSQGPARPVSPPLSLHVTLTRTWLDILRGR